MLCLKGSEEAGKIKEKMHHANDPQIHVSFASAAATLIFYLIFPLTLSREISGEFRGGKSALPTCIILTCKESLKEEYAWNLSLQIKCQTLQKT